MFRDRVRDKKVLVVGIGGLGSPMILTLLQLGVGHIKIIDRDIVSRTDLHRQILYSVMDVGKPKVEAAIERIKEINPEVDVEGITEPVTHENVKDVVYDVDVVLDGLDNLRTRYLLNRACVKWKKPYIFASAVEMFGNISTIIPGKTPCLECFYGGLDDSILPKCGVVGVHPSVLGIVAGIAVSEAVSLLSENKAKLAGKLLFVDLREPSFDVVQLSRNPKCLICRGKVIKFEGLIDDIEESCARDGSGTFFINKRVKVDFSKVKERSEKLGWQVIKQTNYSITLKIDEGIEGTLLEGGSMVFKVKPTAMIISSLRRRLVELHKTLTGEAPGTGFEPARADGPQA